MHQSELHVGTATPGEHRHGSGTLTTPTRLPVAQGAVYTVYVAHDGQTQTLTFTGDGSTDEWTFESHVNTAPSTICLSATSQPNAGASLADTAPDTACTDASQHLEHHRPPGASGMG